MAFRAAIGDLMLLDPTISALFQQMPMLASYPMWERRRRWRGSEFKASASWAIPRGGDRKDRGTSTRWRLPAQFRFESIRRWPRVARRFRRFCFFTAEGFVIGDLDCY